MSEYQAFCVFLSLVTAAFSAFQQKNISLLCKLALRFSTTKYTVVVKTETKTAHRNSFNVRLSVGAPSPRRTEYKRVPAKMPAAKPRISLSFGAFFIGNNKKT
jgi:hypothetical protein